MRDVTLNNQPVDTYQDPATAPAIVFSNPVFFDISQMRANRTSTYRLPRTGRNERVMQGAGLVSSDTRLPRQVATLEERRDGLTVIPAARAALVRTTPTDYELSVTWGALRSVAEELEAIQIRELGDDVIEWSEDSRFMHSDQVAQNVGFLYTSTFSADTPADTERDIRYHFPAVRANLVMDRINERLTEPMAITADLFDELRRLWLPCLSNLQSPERQYRPEAGTLAFLQKSAALRVPWQQEGYVNTEINSVYSTQDALGAVGLQDSWQYLAVPPGEYHLRIDIDATILRGWTPGRVLYTRLLWTEGTAPRALVHPETLQDAPRLDYTLETDLTIAAGQFSEPYSYVFVDFFWDYADATTANPQARLAYDRRPGQPEGDARFAVADLQLWRRAERVEFGSDFPVFVNLPEMSGLDFVKSMMFLHGWYADLNPADGRTWLYRADDTLASEPVDLTPWALAREPGAMEFNNGWARRNWGRWAEEDSVQTNGDGSIDIDDQTLAEDHELFRLSFCPSDTSGSAAWIPVFTRTVNPVSGEVTIEQTDVPGARLVWAVQDYNTDGLLRGQFDSNLQVATVFQRHYQLLLSLMANPRAVDTEIQLPATAVVGFNSTGVYYLWGRYWIQSQTTAAADGSARLRLLMLNR